MKDEHDVDTADPDAEAFFKATVRLARVLIIAYYASIAFAFAVVIATIAGAAVLIAKLLGA